MRIARFGENVGVLRREYKGKLQILQIVLYYLCEKSLMLAYYLLDPLSLIT